MTTQDERNLDTVRRFYQSENELAAEDIVWHVPGDNPVSGMYRGSDEYFNLMPSRMAPLTRWDFTLQHVMVNGDLVVATFSMVGERKSRTISTDGAHLFRLNAAGKIVEGWGFVQKQAELDIFFSA